MLKKLNLLGPQAGKVEFLKHVPILILVGGVAGAAPPSSLEVVETAAQSCPSAEAVARAVKVSMPSVRVEAGTALAEAPRAVIHDLGRRFSVEVAGLSRTFAEPRRRCEERARAAAVFIALTLDPPLLPTEEEPEPPAPPPAVEPPVAPPPPVPPVPPSRPAASDPNLLRRLPERVRERWPESATLDLGLTGAGGVRTGVIGTGGLLLRLALERRAWALVLGTRVEVPVTVRGGFYERYEARVWRIPIDLGARYTWQRGPLGLSGELGAGVELLRFDRVDAPSSLNVRPVGRACVRVGWRLTWAVEPFVAAAAELSPWPVEYRVSQVVVGRLPRLWLSGTLGLALTIL